MLKSSTHILTLYTPLLTCRDPSGGGSTGPQVHGVTMETGFPLPALSLASCVTLGQKPNFAEPQFLYGLTTALPVHAPRVERILKVIKMWKSLRQSLETLRKCISRLHHRCS